MTRPSILIALCLLLYLAAAGEAGTPWQVKVARVERSSPDEAVVEIRSASDAQPLRARCSTLEVHVRFQALRWWTFNLLDGAADPTAGAWAISRGAHRRALDTLEAASRSGATVGFGLLHRGLGPVEGHGPCEVQSNALMISDEDELGSAVYSAFEWPRRPVLF